MSIGKFSLAALATGLLLFASACSSSSKKDKGTLVSASQDLTLDATGQTTVLTFSKSLPAMLTPGNFEADSGQLPTTVTVNGMAATVVWDSRVSPSSNVRALGIGGVPSTFVAVTSTNTAAPTLMISGGTQTAPLGGDTFSVQFSGPNVVEATAEDPANWDLQVNGTSLDLTGSTFDFDPMTQSVAVTLGAGANLHSTFSLSGAGVTSVADVVVGGPFAGTATGDATAPTLVSAVQNLSESEYGFVVDFTFDEPMDPALNMLTAFDAGAPTFATQIEEPSASVLRVTFTGPVIPGQDMVALSGVIDAHGNPVSAGSTAVTAGSTVPNGYVSGGVFSVENVGNDTVVSTFAQALDPDTAGLASSWKLESPLGVDIDLSTSTIDYDFLSKTLMITVDGVDFRNGVGYLFEPTGAPPLDVDGEAFTASVSGTISGDSVLPTITNVTQNRVLDPTGATFDVQFSEDVDTTQAQNVANYTFDSGATTLSATLSAGFDNVRLVLDAETLPGEHTVAVSNVRDIAGNVMAAVGGNATISTDIIPPSVTQQVVYAESGPDNDTVVVTFDDAMVASEVTNPSNWVFESPSGTVLDTTLASVAWNASQRKATLTFDGGDGINLKGGDTFTASFVTMRDIGGNVVSTNQVSGNVDSEQVFPELVSVWVEAGDATKLHVRFDEAVEFLDDSLTSYVIRDAGGLDVGGGPPTVTVDVDQQGATLAWAVGSVAGSNTLDVGGVADLAGNDMFAVKQFPISTEVATAPVLSGGLQTYRAVSGENNDTLSIVFDQPVSRWNLLDPANYALTNGSDSADFTRATLDFDGDSTVGVTFDGAGSINFDNGSYTLTVDGVLSAQGVSMSGASMDNATADMSTDTTAASAVNGRTRLWAGNPTESVLVEMDEAVDSTEALDVANYAISGVNPDTVSLVGNRTVRADWSGGVSVAQVVDITVADLAGNAGLVSEAIQAADSSGPAVISVAGVVLPGAGGDAVRVTFNEPLTEASAVNPGNYTVSSAGSTLDVSGAVISYSSATNSVLIPLPSTIDLVEADTVNVMVSGVVGHSGLAINPPANVNGAIGGDGVAPAFDAAFTNYRRDSGGLVVDVRYSEDVDSTFALDPLNYSLSGGQTVLSTSLVRGDTVRLTLTSALLAGDTVDVTGAPDLAGNVSGLIQIEPVL